MRAPHSFAVEHRHVIPCLLVESNLIAITHDFAFKQRPIQCTGRTFLCVPRFSGPFFDDGQCAVSMCVDLVAPFGGSA